MPIFEYEAQDQQGKNIRGTLFSASEAAAAQALRQQGLDVSRVQTAGVVGAVPPTYAGPSVGAAATQAATVHQTQIPSFQQAFLGVPSLEDLNWFFVQGATMLEAGLTTYDMLTNIGTTSKSEKIRPIAQDLANATYTGQMMSSRMAQHPQAFSPVMISIVEAGEIGGFLPDAMRQVADYLAKSIEMRQLKRRTTMMPKAVIIFSIILALGVNFLVTSIRPGSTIINHPMLNPVFWMIVGPVVIAVFLYRRYVGKVPAIKHVADTLKLFTPLLSDIERLGSVSLFCRSFAALYRAGIDMPRNLEISAHASGNSYVAERVTAGIPMVQGGAPVSSALESSGILDATTVNMLRTGEKTGSIDLTLSKVAEYYENEAKVRATRNSVILGIVVYILAALLVLYIAITFYTSYFAGLLSSAE